MRSSAPRREPCPRHLAGSKKDFSEGAIRRDLENSLRRLRREHIDTYYLHGPETWIVRHTLSVFADLKAAGTIQRAGVCGEGSVIEDAVRDAITDAIMARYNLFDRTHENVFKTAREKGLTVTAIAPLAQAIYRRNFFLPRSLSDMWAIARALVRNREALRVRRSPAAELLSAFAPLSPAQVMLSFALSKPDIDIVMTSTTKSAHLDELAAASAHLLSADKLQKLAALAGSGA